MHPSHLLMQTISSGPGPAFLHSTQGHEQTMALKYMSFYHVTEQQHRTAHILVPADTCGQPSLNEWEALGPDWVVAGSQVHQAASGVHKLQLGKFQKKK